MRHFKVTTASGSEYYLSGDALECTLHSKTKLVLSPTSVATPGSWALKPLAVWPPELHKPMLLLSLYFEDHSSPLRIPGGGKLTSPVVSVEELPSSPS